MGDVYVLLGIVGNITAMVMFLSPTTCHQLPEGPWFNRATFWRIISDRDTGSFSPVPYACTLLNCLLWFFYGLPAVTSNNTLIVTINSAGILLECIYLVVFFAMAPPAHRGYLSMLVVGVMGFFAAAVAVTLSAFKQDERATFVGAVCVVVGTLMYASPLSVIKLVIATRSVEYMPFSLSLCSLINALLWTSYGVLKHDKFLIIPNTLGAILGLLQLAVYSHFQKEAEDTDTPFHQAPDYCHAKLKRSESSSQGSSNNKSSGWR